MNLTGQYEILQADWLFDTELFGKQKRSMKDIKN